MVNLQPGWTGDGQENTGFWAGYRTIDGAGFASTSVGRILNTQTPDNDMSFISISDILESAVQAHVALHDFCKSDFEGVQDQQQELILESLQADHSRIKAAINGYLVRDEFAAALQVMIQFSPEGGIKDQVGRFRKQAGTGFESLVGATTEFYNQMGDSFDQVEEQTESEVASQMLSSLSQLELETAKALSERLNGLDDV